MSTIKIQELLREQRNVPTLPDVVFKVMQLAKDPSSGTSEIGAIIAGDAPLLAKILRLANSSYYGLSGRCVSGETACTVLGLRAVHNIACQVGVMEAFKHLDGHLAVKQIWDHCSRTAQLCWFLAKTGSYGRLLDPADFYAYGLLHDLGKFVLLDALGAKYVAIVDEARRTNTDLAGLEYETLGFDHADAGAFVANRWSLPEAIRQVIQYHHGPPEKIESDPTIGIVHVGSLLLDVARKGEGAMVAVFRKRAGRSLGLSEETIQIVVEYAMRLATGRIDENMVG